MATITGRRTINTIKVLEVDSNPASGGGISAAIGTIASATDGTGIYVKTAAGNTSWTVAGSGGASGANTSLSNLITTTVNQSLVPAKDDGYNFGSSTRKWYDGYMSGLTVSQVSNDVFNVYRTNTGSGGTVFNEAGLARDFRVESDTNANMLFVDGTNNRFGIGTNTPSHFVDISAGTLATTIKAFNISATLPNSSSSEWAVQEFVTSNSSASGTQFGFLRYLLAGFTGAASTTTEQLSNGAQGTLSDVFDRATALFSGNYGMELLASGIGTGANIGAAGVASGSSTINIGLLGKTSDNATTGRTVGVVGMGSGTGVSSRTGGYFFISSAYKPTMTEAGLVADNGDLASPIFIARDNGTSVFTIADSGDVTVAPVSAHSGDAFVITAGTLASTKRALGLTATFTASASTQIGSTWDITSAAGGTGSQYGLILTMNAGFTGANGNTNGIEADNFIAGTGTWNPLTGGETSITDNANSGMFGVAGAATTGTNIGFRSQAYKGAISIGTVAGIYLTSNSGSNVFRQDSLNIGSVNFVTATKHASSTTEKHVGVVGQALGGDVNVAGYFGLHSTAPTFASAALMADNGSTTSDIFVARDAGTTIFGIVNDGYVQFATPASIQFQATTKVQLVANQDNYNIGSGIFFRMSSDASRNITGMIGGFDGRKIIISNVGSQNIVLQNQNTSSSPVNRIITGTGADVTLASDNTATLLYDSTTQRWRIIATH